MNYDILLIIPGMLKQAWRSTYISQIMHVHRPYVWEAIYPDLAWVTLPVVNLLLEMTGYFSAQN